MVDPSPDVPSPEPKRRPFLEPVEAKPLLKNPEMQKVLVFIAFLVLIGVFALIYTLRPPKTSESSAARPASPSRSETPSPRIQFEPDSEEAEERQDERRFEERRQRVFGLFEGALASARDGTDFDESSDYRKILQLLSDYSPESVSARVTGHLDYAKAMSDPGFVRGQFVRVRGLIAWIRPEKLSEQLPNGVEDIYRGVITEADGSEGVAFDLVERPPPFEPRRDAVDIEGVFFRTVRFATEKGTTVEVPYVIARNVQVVPLSGSQTHFAQENFWIIGFGLALALGFGVVVIYRTQRRVRRQAKAPLPRAGFREMFEKQLKAEGRKPPAGPPA